MRSTASEHCATRALRSLGLSSCCRVKPRRPRAGGTPRLGVRRAARARWSTCRRRTCRPPPSSGEVHAPSGAQLSYSNLHGWMWSGVTPRWKWA
eukprot:scaffold128379_cov75-Phaeocystis_antarctica.AAC.2